MRALRVRRGEQTLPPVDLTIERGRVVLLEGPSGAGKSSVVAALLGFADYGGEIVIDGMRVADARHAIAWAGQRPGLVSGTVAANVSLGVGSHDADLVRRSLADASVAEIGPDLELGAGGSGLSGGQAQRVAVARALYRVRSGAASVLVLDEPSSALDAETEGFLWRAVRAAADDGAAVLLVSHRPSARMIADIVVALPAIATVPLDAVASGWVLAARESPAIREPSVRREPS